MTEPAPVATTSRNAALRDILERDEADLIGEWPEDRRVPLTPEPTARRLAALLEDVAYTATFRMEGDKQLLSSLTIGLANTDTADLDAALTNEEPFDSSLALARQLDEADAQEQVYLIDDSELSDENLSVMRTRLAALPDSTAEAELQQAIMRRLDLADEVGGRLAILQALNSPNDAVVEMALDSIDTWNDRSISPWLERVADHPNPVIADRIQLAISDIALIAPVPSGPSRRDIDIDALLDEAQQRRESLQRQRENRMR